MSGLVVPMTFSGTGKVQTSTTRSDACRDRMLALRNHELNQLDEMGISPR